MSGQPGGNRRGRGGRSASDSPQGGDEGGPQEPPQGGPQGGQQGGQQGAPQGGPGGPGGPQGGPGGPGTGQPPDDGGNNEMLGYEQEKLIDFAKLGGIVYGLLGIGLFISTFLVLTMASDESILFFVGDFSGGGDEPLFSAAVGTYLSFTTWAILLAVALAFFFYYAVDLDGPTYTPTLVAALAGTVAITILMLLLSVIFSPDGVDVSIGDELGGLIGLYIGTAIAAGAVGYVLDEFWEM